MHRRVFYTIAIIQVAERDTFVGARGALLKGVTQPEPVPYFVDGDAAVTSWRDDIVGQATALVYGLLTAVYGNRAKL